MLTFSSLLKYLAHKLNEMQKFSNLLPIPINKSLQATTNPFISC